MDLCCVYKGPFVMVEDFIRLTLESQLPDPPTSGMSKMANGKWQASNFKLATSTIFKSLIDTMQLKDVHLLLFCFHFRLHIFNMCFKSTHWQRKCPHNYVKCHWLIQWYIFTGLPDVELPVNGIDDGEENMDVEQQKRGIKRQGDHESDDEGNSVAPPVNDIYRTRQQKRVH